MVNTDDFIKRLEIMLDYYALNASSFADKIGVQRSSLSHLLSGRNKPSLDFVIKIESVFPEVDLNWIINGKGSFPKSESKNSEIVILPTPLNEKVEIEKKAITQTDLFSEKIDVSNNKAEEIIPVLNSIPKNENQNVTEKQIERIVIFYSDGTFKNYLSE